MAFALGMLVYKNHNLVKIEVGGRRSFFNIFKIKQNYSVHNMYLLNRPELLSVR